MAATIELLQTLDALVKQAEQNGPPSTELVDHVVVVEDGLFGSTALVVHETEQTNPEVLSTVPGGLLPHVGAIRNVDMTSTLEADFLLNIDSLSITKPFLV